jgi:hypothetical protein
MSPTQIGNDGNERGLGPLPAVLALAVAVQVGQYLQRFVLTERVDADDHICPSSGRLAALTLGIGGANIGPERRASAHAVLEGLEAEQIQKELVQRQSQRGGAEMIEPIPKEAVLGHDLVGRDVLIVREGPIVGVDVDDVDGELGGVQHVESVAEGVGRGPVSPAGVGHENLDGVWGDVPGGGGGGGSAKDYPISSMSTAKLLLFNLIGTESRNGSGLQW